MLRFERIRLEEPDLLRGELEERLAGLHMIAVGLGYPRVSGIIIQVLLLAFFGVFNWAAFFTTHTQCTESLSFLGIELIRHIPSEESCSNGLKVIVGTIDLLIFLGKTAILCIGCAS